jgi:hypothetical protein
MEVTHGIPSKFSGLWTWNVLYHWLSWFSSLQAAFWGDFSASIITWAISIINQWISSLSLSLSLLFLSLSYYTHTHTQFVLFLWRTMSNTIGHINVIGRMKKTKMKYRPVYSKFLINNC